MFQYCCPVLFLCTEFTGNDHQLIIAVDAAAEILTQPFSRPLTESLTFIIAETEQNGSGNFVDILPARTAGLDAQPSVPAVPRLPRPPVLALSEHAILNALRNWSVCPDVVGTCKHKSRQVERLL